MGLTEEARVVGAGALFCTDLVADGACDEVRACAVVCAGVRAGKLGIAVGIGSAMLSLEKKEAATPPRLFKKLPSCLRSWSRLCWIVGGSMMAAAKQLSRIAVSALMRLERLEA